MIFDNFWFTNFVADSHGVMEFQFDLAWRKEAAGLGRRSRRGPHPGLGASGDDQSRAEGGTRSSSSGSTSRR